MTGPLVQPLALVASGRWPDLLLTHLGLPQVVVVPPDEPLPDGLRAVISTGPVATDLPVVRIAAPTASSTGLDRLRLAPELEPGNHSPAYHARRSLYYCIKRLRKRGLHRDAERLDLRLALHTLDHLGFIDVGAWMASSCQLPFTGEPPEPETVIQWSAAGAAMKDAAQGVQLGRLRPETFAQAPGLLWSIHLRGGPDGTSALDQFLLPAIRSATTTARVAQLVMLALVSGRLEDAEAGVDRVHEAMSSRSGLPVASAGATGFAYDPSVAAVLAWFAIRDGATQASLDPDRVLDRPVTMVDGDRPFDGQPLVELLLDRLTAPDLGGHPLELTDDRYRVQLADVLDLWRTAFRMAADRAGISLLEVLPWPPGTTCALSIRVDIDRPATPEQVRTLRDRMRAAVGTCPVSWYAIPGSGHEAEVQGLLRDEGHPIGVHGQEPDDARRGRGLTCHSAPTSRYWLGADTVLTAEARGADHVEHLTSLLDVPGPLWMPGPQVPSTTFATPLHFPLEGSTVDRDLSYFDERVEAFRSLLARGGHAIIGTHNDIDPDLLTSVLRRERRADMWFASVEDVVARRRLLSRPGAVRADATHVSALEDIGPVTVLVHDRSPRTSAVDLAAGQPVRVG